MTASHPTPVPERAPRPPVPFTALSPRAVLHSEWIKIRSVRASYGSVLAVFLVTVAVTLLVSATVGRTEADNADAELLFNAFYALNFGQIAAISLGVTAVSAEFLNGALGVSLTAVPRRGLLYAAKTAVIGAAALVAGVPAGFVTLLGGQAFLGEYAIGLGTPGALRACFGAGLYLALMALFAAGLCAVLRSAVAALSILIPFVLIVSFVVGDAASDVAAFLPDRAGQQILHADPTGPLGPWSGLAVCAAWAALALAAGWWSLRRRDA